IPSSPSEPLDPDIQTGSVSVASFKGSLYVVIVFDQIYFPFTHCGASVDQPSDGACVFESDIQYDPSTASLLVHSSPPDPVNDNENEKFLVNSFPSTRIVIGTLPCTVFRDVSAVNLIVVLLLLLLVTIAFNPVIPLPKDEELDTAISLIFVTFAET